MNGRQGNKLGSSVIHFLSKNCFCSDVGNEGREEKKTRGLDGKSKVYYFLSAERQHVFINK
jgi:hypothetical protein